MTPFTQQAIERAVKSGYKGCEGDEFVLDEGQIFHFGGKVNEYRIFFDPAFWIALGRAEGWNDHSTIDYRLPENEEERRKMLIDLENNIGVIISQGHNIAVVSPYRKGLDYKGNWHLLLDHLGDGGTAETFFQSLLENNSTKV